MSSSSLSTYSNLPERQDYFYGVTSTGRLMTHDTIHRIGFSGIDPATGWEDSALNLTPANISHQASSYYHSDSESASGSGSESEPESEVESSHLQGVTILWIYRLPMPPPPARDASPASLERGCVVCSSPFHLSLCPQCECAYVCHQHSPTDDPHHRSACRKLWRARLALQTELECLLTLDYVSRTDYRVEQCEVANALLAMNTQLSMDKAIGLYYQLTQTSCVWSRFFEARFMIPRELFRLGRLEECFNYVKFWTLFAGLRERSVPAEEYKRPYCGSGIWDGDMRPIVRRGGETTLNCLLIVLLIKLSLWLNIKEIQSAGYVCRRRSLPNEIISVIQEEIACPAILNNEDIYTDMRATRSFTPHTRELNREVVQLRDTIVNGNRAFLRLFAGRNSQSWQSAAGIGSQGDGPPAGFLRRRGSEAEAIFVVYNNIQLLQGHLGNALEFVLAVRCPGRYPDEMYGPGKGWLDG